MKAKRQDKVFKGIMIFSSVLVISMLVLILGFVIIKGAGEINKQFLFGDFDAKTVYIDINTSEGLDIQVEQVEYDSKDYLKVIDIEGGSFIEGSLSNGEEYKLKVGDIIKKVDDSDTNEMSAGEFYTLSEELGQSTTLRITRPGRGIFPLLVNTVLMIGLSLLFALPISIASAIYLAEYAKEGRLLNLIRFTTSCLAGIPSIVFGLFGMLVFVSTIKFGFSLLAGSFTLSIVLLPTIIGQTEEAIRRVPQTFREGSFALGANKIQTIFKVILPNGLSGILVGVLLSIGRIVAESAALILTAGTVASIPGTALESASTLTVKAYTVAKETGDIRLACAMGIIAILLIVIVNASVGLANKFDKMKNYE